MNGIPVLFTADTGASKTVISQSIFQPIADNNRPKLKKGHSLKTANGDPIKSLGQGMFTLQLGPIVLKQNIVVADIENEVLLGIDILHDKKNGSANILLSEGIIQFRGVSLPCVDIKSAHSECLVTVAEDVIIPGHSEVLIDAFIERKISDDYGHGDMLIEQTDNFSEMYSLLLAPVLVNTHGKTSTKIRLMNPFPTDVTLKQDAVVGQAAPAFEALECATVVSQEESELSDNFSSIRGIKLDKQHLKSDNLSHQAEFHHDPPFHLKELFDSATSKCSGEEKNKVASTLSKYASVFSKDEADLGLTHLVEHTIDTANATPVKQRPRRTPLAFAGEEENVIKDLEEKGIIRQSSSPWASPIVLVRKKNGKVRPCVDYRKLNSATIKYAFPLPRIQDCLDAVSGAKYFSTFDLTSGYHQIPVKAQDIPKTAFVTKYGLYEFTTMPFGLTNAPATFQRVMELALQGLQWQQCLIYLDDIIVFGRTFEEHMCRVEEVLSRIAKAGMKLQPSKCHLLQPKVTFLGHIVSEDGVLPNQENVSKIKHWPIPTSVTNVRQFIGIVSYYRRFIKDFSQIARPIVDLTKKTVPFVWSNQCQEAFDELKARFIGPEKMAYPADEGGYILDTDACDVSIGAVLSQVQGDRERVIAYASRTLNLAEKNYCVTDKELLAVRYFMEYFRQYLLGRTFLIRTDHQALVWLLSFKEPKSRIALMSSFTSKLVAYFVVFLGFLVNLCRFTSLSSSIRAVQTRASTNPSPSSNTTNVKSDWVPWAGIYTTAALRSMQQRDSEISPVIKWMNKSERPPSSEIAKENQVTRHYWLQWDNFKMKDGLLFRKHRKKDGSGEF